MKTKRFFSLFLALTLVLSMFPVSADGGVTEYNLWIGGTQVTSDNASDVLGDGTVSYNPTDNILTLNGANITKVVTDVPEGDSEDEFGNLSHEISGIYYGGDSPLTVKLVRENSITTTGSIENASVAGFYSTSVVTFTGDGFLTVTADDSAKKFKKCYGIYVVGKSVIDSGTTVKAIAKSATDFSCGFFAMNGLDVSGKLTGKGGSARNSEGISVYNGMVVNDGGEVTATADSASVSIGLSCQSSTDVDGLTVDGGSVTATGGAAKSTSGDAVGSISTGILVSGAGNFGILIKNGSVTANGGESSGTSKNVRSYGIKCNTIVISGGTVVARGGEVKNESGNVQLNALSCGIDSALDMHIGGNAIVTAAGGDAKCSHSSAKGYSVSAGISVYSQYEEPSLTIGENAEVNASSANEGVDVNSTKRVSHAIFAVNIRIDGGNVTATAENCHYSYGMLCGADDDNHITISGGNVTAIGYSQALSKAPILSEGVTAGGSENVDGSNAEMYNTSNNEDYNWFQSPFDAPIIYAISLSPDSYYFGELCEGYAAPTPVTVTVTNTGTVETGVLSISVKGDHATSFTCSPYSIENIESGEIATFTVAPVTGLGEGAYNAEVNITGEHNIQEIIEVNLLVNSADDTGNPGDTGGSGDPGDTGGTVYTDDTDDAYDSDNNDEDSTSSSTVVEETQTAEISDDKNHEKIEVKTDKKKGTALVELKDTKQFSGKDIVVKMPKIKDVTNNILSVPVARLSKKPREGSITFETHIAGIVLPSNMLTDIAKITGKRAEIGVEETKKTDLPADVKEKIGNNPLVSLNLSIDNVPFRWNNKAAAIRVSIPYIPSEKELENLDGITAYHVDDRGKLIEMEDAKYDPKTKSVVFKSTQLGNYVVGFDEEKEEAEAEEVEELNFSDVDSGAWYYDAVNYLASKKITNGTGNGKFSPKAPLSRAQFIVMLMRSYGIEPDASNADNFSDAGDAYYTNYLATAKRLGIAKGVGDNKFAPEKEISREAMFTLLYNALKVLDKLPEGDSGKTLSDFGDGAEVSDWAKEAVTEMVKNGTVVGFNDMLKPANGTNRAEMAQLLYKLFSIK